MTHTDNHFVFFLGGHDAEMIAIREILDQYSCAYVDGNLKWGAALSVYSQQLEALQTQQKAVLIELKLDIDPPPGSILVDHHGERAGENQKTSIEQVAQLLGICLNRRQQLIAANDRAHIAGMEAMGADPQEIEDIRAFDRRCQGVTPQEEKTARYRADTFHSSGLLDVIEYPDLRTSPLLDRLHGRYQNLLIQTPSHFEFYGSGKVAEDLGKRYHDSWYGGNLPQRGYWGAPAQSIDKVQLLANIEHDL